MRPKVILLVEDNPDDEELTLRALKRNNFFNDVVVARDGVEALDFLFATNKYAGRDVSAGPALVLLDVKLPLLDGFEVLRRIRSDDRTKFLPVVILTTSREHKDLASGYSLGANSYIVKPVDSSKFSDTVRQLGLYWLMLNQDPPAIERC